MNTTPQAPTFAAHLPSHVSEPSDFGLPCLRSEELFGKQREIMIKHAGGYYRLRLTHSNKLILTK